MVLPRHQATLRLQSPSPSPRHTNAASLFSQSVIFPSCSYYFLYTSNTNNKQEMSTRPRQSRPCWSVTYVTTLREQGNKSKYRPVPIHEAQRVFRTVAKIASGSKTAPRYNSQKKQSYRQRKRHSKRNSRQSQQKYPMVMLGYVTIRIWPWRWQ
ncbi:hypothetical protein M431DRAFT_204782 [Trichoderma harzianum CBS 226.95]|uniref:Uncharacterized protein n=1 Tax=Trichoderma harzianum CBS 226.95 TaxID=983964 RepID=A0A2T4AVZ7_TRIHA|nr:hypothetical protein M431DRAFT_204782 [Trichoderma harzianum CBS 226.95]PTB61148.1 hypothetical protein M431DRAFT_204782 [Trichoderma harzianum CBS 226.95]